MVFAFVAFGVLRLASRRKRLVVFLVGETLTLNAASSGFYHATEDGPSPVAETDSHGQTRTILLQPDWENFVDPSTIVKQTMPNCDCAATSQIQLVISVGATGISSSSDSWHLQTMDQTGRLKTTGGDEFYVRFEWHRDDVTTKVVDSDRRGSRRRPNRRRKNVETTAVARITDWRNGTYGLAFVTTPLNTYLPYKNTSGHGIFHASQQKGTLTVDLQYTCGMGRMDPPLKDHNRTDRMWTTGGMIGDRYRTPSVLSPPSMLTFIRPTDMDHSIDLSRYRVRQFTKDVGKAFQKNLVFRGKGIFQELNTSRVVEYLEQLDSIYGADLSRAYSSNFSFSSSTTALLLGSAAWDLLQPSNINGTHWGDEDWVDHSNAIRIVIEHVRINYPIVDVYWKSPAALHVHRVDRNNAAATDRARYMAASRSRRLYEVQKQLLQSLGVPFLDVYEAFYLSGDWCFDEDGRHYAVWLNYVVLGWFFGKDERSGQLEMI